MTRLVALSLLLAVAACAEIPLADLDAPQDSTAGGGKADDPACSVTRCGDPAAPNILFPGNPACGGRGCEGGLASADLYIPPRNGRPWGDTYELGTEDPITLAGFSSGRIAFLRRLGLVGDGQHAVLLDPSWPDGERDFLGHGPERGEDIVHAWLAADDTRTFTLLYSRRSVGWDTYVALQASDVGAQVKICPVDTPHLLIPAIANLATLLADPVPWDNGACTWGAAPDA